MSEDNFSNVALGVISLILLCLSFYLGSSKDNLIERIIKDGCYEYQADKQNGNTKLVFVCEEK